MDKNELINIARKYQGEFSLNNVGVCAGSVASALVTENGNVYTGICVVVHCGIGFCAEHAAVAEMLKNRETRIKSIVAVTETEIIPPCGRCRELLIQINKDNDETDVIVSENKSIRLNELLPLRFIKEN